MGDAEELAALRRLAELEEKAGNPAPSTRRSLGIKANLEARPTRSGEVVSNAIREAVAGVPDMFLNAPSNLMNLGRASQGMLEHTMGDPNFAPELTQAPSPVRGFFEKQGWIKPQQFDPQTSGERYLAAGAGGASAGAMGGLPGMAVGGVAGLIGQAANEATGSPIAGILANLLASKGANVAANYGAGKVALAQELRKQKQPLIDTLNEVRSAGFVIPPATTNPTMLNKIMESAGGKAATAQDASMLGNEVTASLARKDLGVPSSTGLTSDALDALANVKAQPYRDVSALPPIPPKQIGTIFSPSGNKPMMSRANPSPSDLLKDLRDARLDAKANWKKFSVAGGASERAAYEASAAKVKALEDGVEKSAVAAGRPELVAQLRQARTDIAKIHDVDRALNTDRGEVSAIDLAKARERGVPLSGGLETAAKMGNSYSKAIQDASKIGSPGTNNLNSMLGAGGGAALGGPIGAAIGVGATPVIQSLIRKLILSKGCQNTFGTPNYDASMTSRAASKIGTTPEDALLRAYILSQQQGQQP